MRKFFLLLAFALVSVMCFAQIPYFSGTVRGGANYMDTPL